MPGMTPYIFTTFVPAVVNLGLGVYVWTRNPEARENRLLALACLGLSVYSFRIFEAYTRPLEIAEIIFPLLTFGPLFAGAFLSDFLLTLSRRPLLRRRWLAVLIIYGPTTFFSVGEVFTDWFFGGFKVTDAGGVVSLGGPYSLLMNIFMLALLLFAIVQALRTLFTSSDPNQKKQLLWSISGIGIGTLINLLILEESLFPQTPPQLSIVSVAFTTTLIAGTMTYTIVKHGLVPSVAELRRQRNQALLERNQALEKANRQIQEATRHKSEYLARMSHDLRTPMNAIIGYTRILLRRLKGAIDDREYRNLANIRISADNLLSLINDILDLSKIEAGRIDINLENVDLKQLATECAVSVESLVKPGVQLERQLEDVHPVYTDADRIRRVVMNLLSNALKFTEQGRITVSLKPADGWVELSVADTGSGIPVEDLPHIFDDFRQVERQGGVQTEGTGLGLAIAKKSVEMLGGTISAESEVGKGAKFTFRIKDYQPE